MTLIAEAKEQCKKCFHFQVCASTLKNDLCIREVMLGEKEPKCKMFVEVVQCKDCKKWYRHTMVDRERGDCRRYQTTKHESGFCDKGERRTDDEQ